MPVNMGPIDRIIRMIVGLFVVSLVFWGPQSPWGWLGLILVVTSLFARCPLYVPFKISTAKKELPKK